jgi:hypothetical protein
MGKQIEYALHDSLARVLTKIATLLPAVLALLVAIAAAALVGAVLAYALRRLLTAMHFDERMQRGQTANRMDWAAIQSPARAVSRIVFWGCTLLGVVVGVAAFASGYSNSELMAASMFPYVAHTVGAVILLIAGTLAARFLARSVLIGAVNMNLHYARLLSQGVKWLVLVLTVAMALDHLGIGGRIVELAFGILFGGIVLTLALSVGLGSRDIVIRTLEQDAPRSAHQGAHQDAPHSRVTHF